MKIVKLFLLSILLSASLPVISRADTDSEQKIRKEEALLRENPTDLKIYSGLLDTYWQEKAYDSFRQLLKGLQKIVKPDNEILSLNLAREAYLNNNFVLAEKILNKIQENQNKFILLSKIYLKQGKEHEALQLAEKLKDIKESLSLKKEIFLKSFGDCQEICIKNAFDSGFSFSFELANTYMALDKYDISEKLLLTATELANSQEEYNKLKDLAIYLRNITDNYKYSNSFYQSLSEKIRKNPFSEAGTLLIKHYHELGNNEEILNIYRIQLLNSSKLSNNEKSEIFEKMADLYTEMNQFPLNTDNYQRALEFSPGKTQIIKKIAWNLLLSDKVRESEKYYDMILEINSDDQKALLGKAIIHYLKGDAGTAMDILRRIRGNDEISNLMKTISRYELSRGAINNMLRRWGV